MKVLTEDGFKEFNGTRLSESYQKIDILLSNGNHIKCTPEHKLRMKDGEFKEAINIKVGDVLYNDISIENIEYYEDDEFVYDLVDVKDTNSYLTNGVTSHNCVFIDECIGGDSIVTVRNKNTGKEFDISIKDLWSIASENMVFDVKTSNGYQNFYGVRKTRKESLKIRFKDNTHIICSPEHKFYDSGIFTYANSLKVGGVISNKEIISIDSNGEEDLYDLLEVENGHHYTANNIEVSNCAFIPKNLWKEFFKSTWPTISSGKDSRFILVSTPNSRNHYYDLWIDAKNGKSKFYPMEVNWWNVPGRDENWRDEQLMVMSEEEFNVEYGNSFDSTTNTLISPYSFKRLEDGILKPIQHSDNTKIYELPQKGHNYIGTVDCADGGGDFSTISIIDITNYPYRQVAVYANNNISHLTLPQIIMNLCLKYNNAYVLVESNEIGNTVLYILNYDLEYENVIHTINSARGNSQLGQKTTKKTKKAGCSRLKDMIEKEGIVIQDKGTVDELRHFSKSGDSYAAETGFHDDLVMGLVNFAYYASTPQFRMIYDTNFSDEFRERYDSEAMEELTPIPLFGANLLSNTPSDEERKWLNS